MATYASVDQIRSSMGDITSAQIPDSDITEAIEETEGLINSFCASRYSVPFDPVPNMIQRITRDITVYHLFNDNIAAGHTVQDDVKVYKRYENAMRLLKDIRDGKMIIYGASTTSRKHLWSSTEDYKHVFDVDDETEWGVDSNMLDDVEDDRDEADSVLPGQRS